MTASTDFVTRILDTLGPAPTAQSLVAALVPEMADSCLLFRREGDRYRMVAWAHIDPAKIGLLDELATFHHPSVDDPRDPVALVARSGKGVLVSWITRQNIERATNDVRVHAVFDAFGPRNVVIVPISNGAYVMVCAISDTSRKFFEDDLDFLTQVAERGGPLLPDVP